ncbi:MAG TPA: trypsin-like peptidase domain-containing protein [Caulobacteraceae bacterium]|nr:trypsin-like peptidase domain-containing protein [Caulobacteraceae bacterium]
MKLGVWVLALATLAAVGKSQAQGIEASAMPAITVSKVTSNIAEGTPWITLGEGPICFPSATYRWNGGGAGKLNVRGFEKPIRDELHKENIRIANDPDSPFPEEIASNLLVGAKITSIKANFCVPMPIIMVGNASIGVEWQIYDTRERKVIFTLQTNAESKTGPEGGHGYLSTIISAMDENVRALTASPGFKAMLARQELVGDKPDELKSAQVENTKIALIGSLTAKPAKISDAVGAVVLVESGGGHGSGVLVSSDGYVLTDQHVVGAEKFVKIRWSDGLEGLGEVVRSDRRRDVALIKTDARGRLPLALRAQPPEPGATVFAIGAPEDPKLQSTVTRGVVSAANRIVDGFSFIQSDVTVNPGNSGGPLLDEDGKVLGLTDWKLQTRDNATGLNFFTPIGDALAFLSLEPR